MTLLENAKDFYSFKKLKIHFLKCLTCLGVLKHNYKLTFFRAINH